MRITFVTRIYRPEPSAASMMLGAVADQLVAKGHQVDVLTAKPPKNLPLKVTRERVKTFAVLRDKKGYLRGYVQYMSFDLPLFFRLLFTKRPDVVFVEPPPTTGAVVRLVCAIRQLPYVYDAADIWTDAASHSTSSSLVISVLRKLEKFAMNGARKIVTISTEVRDRLRYLGVLTDVQVTGFGGATNEFFYEKQEAIEPVFVYAGTYSELHGAEILIEAFALFSEKHPGFRLRFIGNGTLTTKMKELAEALGVSQQVSFEGPVSPAELRTIISTSTGGLATLLPDGGYEYAFATKIYSKLLSGIPVIFAGPGPTKRFIEQNSRQAPLGFAVSYDKNEIFKAMSELVTNPLGSHEREHIAKWAGQHCSIYTAAGKVSEVIALVGVNISDSSYKHKRPRNRKSKHL